MFKLISSDSVQRNGSLRHGLYWASEQDVYLLLQSNQTISTLKVRTRAWHLESRQRSQQCFSTALMFSVDNKAYYCFCRESILFSPENCRFSAAVVSNSCSQVEFFGIYIIIQSFYYFRNIKRFGVLNAVQTIQWVLKWTWKFWNEKPAGTLVVSSCTKHIDTTNSFQLLLSNGWIHTGVFLQASPRPCWSPPGLYPPYRLGGHLPPPNASTPDLRGLLVSDRRCPATANPTSATATSTQWPSSDARCLSLRWAALQQFIVLKSAKNTPASTFWWC